MNSIVFPHFRSKAWLLLPVLFLCVVSSIPTLTYAASFNVIYTFTGGSDPAQPYAGLSMDSAGNFYGTTLAGGTGNGTVFKLSPSGSGWTLTTLHEFTGVTGGNDGAGPRARVVIGPDGNLYGTTFEGGRTGCGTNGCGTVFKLSNTGSGWSETVLYRFTGGTDGGEPTGDLLFDASGNILGTTELGGKPHSCGGLGCGTVFKLSNSGGSWTESVLYQFVGGSSDGAFPNSGVVFDTSGNLYGTTCCGSSHNDGTVFQLKPSGSGWTENVLYIFTGSSDGNEPDTGVIFDAAGNLYGSTVFGGTGNGGTVFELTPSGGNWTFSALYDFTGIQGPHGSLVLDAGGNLYGTTNQDGSQQSGSVFLLTPSSGSWTYTSLHDFTGGNDGELPISNLVFDTSGNLYGTASLGGANGQGVVFEVTPPPVPPVITQQPHDQIVTVGNTATFQVTAIGTPPLTYQWFKNGIAILGATHASYTTPPTTLADNGELFKVTVNNITHMPVTSNTVTLTVNNLQTVATPSISPNGGTYTNSVTVTLSDATLGAQIYYTTDGSYPTQGSTLYSAPFVLTNNATVSAVSFESMLNPSAEAQAQFIVNNLQPVATPTITPNGGTFTKTVTVTLGDTTSGAQIYYTTDGSAPTQSSILYSTPFVLTKNATVSAVGFENTLNPSSEAQAQFSITTSSGGATKSGGGTLDWMSLLMLLGMVVYLRGWRAGLRAGEPVGDT